MLNIRIKIWLTIVILCWAFTVLATDERQQIPLQTYGANTYYIDSQIQGAGHFTLLVDTGSGYSVINENTLALLMASDSAVFIKDLRGVLADGSTRVVPLYRVTAIIIGERCVIHDIEAVVFPGDTRQILGVSALQKIAPFEISFEPPMLSLSRCSSSTA